MQRKQSTAEKRNKTEADVNKLTTDEKKSNKSKRRCNVEMIGKLTENVENILLL